MTETTGADFVARFPVLARALAALGEHAAREMPPEPPARHLPRRKAPTKRTDPG